MMGEIYLAITCVVGRGDVRGLEATTRQKIPEVSISIYGRATVVVNQVQLSLCTWDDGIEY